MSRRQLVGLIHDLWYEAELCLAMEDMEGVTRCRRNAAKYQALYEARFNQ